MKNLSKIVQLALIAAMAMNGQHIKAMQQQQTVPAQQQKGYNPWTTPSAPQQSQQSQSLYPQLQQSPAPTAQGIATMPQVVPTGETAEEILAKQNKNWLEQQLGKATSGIYGGYQYVTSGLAGGLRSTGEKFQEAGKWASRQFTGASRVLALTPQERQSITKQLLQARQRSIVALSNRDTTALNYDLARNGLTTDNQQTLLAKISEYNGILKQSEAQEDNLRSQLGMPPKNASSRLMNAALIAAGAGGMYLAKKLGY